MTNRIVVAGAIIKGSEVLVAQRNRPPELAGRWELPGGKVTPGETESAALARELAEELDVDVAVGDRLGDDVPLSETTTLRAYQVRLLGGEPHPRDHQALRWVTAAELHSVDWVPADRAWLPDLTQALRGLSARGVCPNE
jgi:8-oxo-dGTP diphosphatase